MNENLGRTQGWAGWSPVPAIADRGADKVMVIADFVGGEANKPTSEIGKYVGVDGLVADIEDAVALPKGATGEKPKMNSTSITSNVIGTGAKTFILVTPIDLVIGQVAKAYSLADPTNYVLGYITNISPTSIEINVSEIGGTGTKTDWVITLGAFRGNIGISTTNMTTAGTILGLNTADSVPQSPKQLSVVGASIVANVFTITYQNAVTAYNAASGVDIPLTNAMSPIQMFQNLQKQLDNSAKLSGGNDFTGTQKINTTTTISETIGGAGAIIGNGVRASTATNNYVRKITGAAANFILMRYDLGIEFHTNITGSGSAEMSDSTNNRFSIEIDGKVKSFTAPTTANEVVRKTELDLKIDLSQKGVANGVVPLNSSTLIDQTYLPSYVDDIIDGYKSGANFYKEVGLTTVITGETGKIYVDLTTGQNSKQYRWSGSAYIQITNGLIASTNDVAEGGSNLYFTVARVLATVISGFSAAAGVVANTDTILQAINKIVGNIAALQTAIDAKVADNLTASTTVAPSKTAVNTALALKADIAASTGTLVALTFTSDSVQGTIASPLTGNITGNITGAKLGVVTLVIHNHTTAPTFDSKYKKLSGSGSYVTGSINYIFCEYINDTEIIYSINQRT